MKILPINVAGGGLLQLGLHLQIVIVHHPVSRFTPAQTLLRVRRGTPPVNLHSFIQKRAAKVHRRMRRPTHGRRPWSAGSRGGREFHVVRRGRVRGRQRGRPVRTGRTGRQARVQRTTVPIPGDNLPRDAQKTRWTRGRLGDRLGGTRTAQKRIANWILLRIRDRMGTAGNFDCGTLGDQRAKVRCRFFDVFTAGGACRDEPANADQRFHGPFRWGGSGVFHVGFWPRDDGRSGGCGRAELQWRS